MSDSTAPEAELARPPERASLPAVLSQFTEEAAHLRRVRSILVRGPRVLPLHLRRHDERIAAHLDGIACAGAQGAAMTLRSLERAGSGEVFVAMVGAIEAHSEERIFNLLSIADAVPTVRAGILSAFGWVPAADLKGIVMTLLAARIPWQREVGLMACVLHGVDPGAMPGRKAFDADPDPGPRASALRIAAACGRVDLRDRCLAALADADRRCAFQAARSALLLGDRTAALEVLEELVLCGVAGSAFAEEAMRLLLKVVPVERARSVLASIARNGNQLPRLIQGIGLAGDSRYVPWLLVQMEDPRLARSCGEAFSLITGIDLVALKLDRPAPDSAGFGPSDDPNDDRVAMDNDDGLAWPDVARLADWWTTHCERWVPGIRHFMGQPPTPESCRRVLRTGFQRQRRAAADYLSLLVPGTPFFNTAAPAWRQQRLLAKLGP